MDTDDGVCAAECGVSIPHQPLLRTTPPIRQIPTPYNRQSTGTDLSTDQCNVNPTGTDLSTDQRNVNPSSRGSTPPLTGLQKYTLLTMMWALPRYADPLHAQVYHSNRIDNIPVATTRCIKASTWQHSIRPRPQESRTTNKRYSYTPMFKMPTMLDSTTQRSTFLL